MAFHLACPLTCRKICDCTLGAPGPLQIQEGQAAFLSNAEAVEKLLSSWGPLVAGRGEETVNVLVPRLSKEHKKKKQRSSRNKEHADDSSLTASKRAVICRKMTVISLAAAEAAAKSGQAADAASVGAPRQGASVEELTGVVGAIRFRVPEGLSAEDLLQPLVPQVVCGLCSAVEVVGSEREMRMLSCRKCSKKYHRKCLKLWADHRDLFNWASWVCGSCCSCEVCKRTGEPNKLMFCKRCDGAYHVYCQQPPLKHVPKGPYLCPKHTRCHSCASNLPGSGVSSRWFMQYMACDACGRLFAKDKYCPICLKVYRDSEVTPMVCCDTCEHWVHCRCDGISDEKFHLFQSDDNLRYKCAACRGECYKVKSVDAAVWEIWRRRDENDSNERAALRQAAGLPSEEELLKLCPSSDDDEKQLRLSSQSAVYQKNSKKAAKRPSKNSRKSAAKKFLKGETDFVGRSGILVNRHMK